MTRSTKLAAATLAGLSALALFAPFICSVLGLDAQTVRADARYLPLSLAHPLGTDELGRDFLARLLLGTRVSLAITLLATSCVAVTGIAIGLHAGYRGGRFDRAFLLSTDALRALPKLPLMMLLTALDLDVILGGWMSPAFQSISKLVLIIALFGWVSIARIARAEAIHLSASDYVMAARAMGLSTFEIVRRHVLPNAAGALIVGIAIEAGEVVVYEGVLSFLGLGVLPPTPSLGTMLRHSLSALDMAPRLAILPGLVTFAAVASFLVAGDGVRERLDPRRAKPSLG